MTKLYIKVFNACTMHPAKKGVFKGRQGTSWSLKGVVNTP